MAEPLRNITRVDHARTHAWWARIYRTDESGEKNCLSQMFSDGVHGGKRKALVAAKAWRDRMLELLPRAKNSGYGLKPPGYGYVTRAMRKRRVGVHPVWVAWIRLDDRRAASSNFSVTVHGERGAKRKAEAYLAAKRRELGLATGSRARPRAPRGRRSRSAGRA